MASAAITIFVAILIAGRIIYRPHRALNTIRAEREIAVVEHVIEARLAHPEIVKITRVDRHPFYVLVHIGVFCYAVCVFGGAALTSNVSALGAQTRFTMAICFAVGSFLVLTGATLGMRVGKWRVVHGVHEHLTSSVLGDDIVLPYRLAMAGMGAMAVSLSIYSSTSFKSTTGSLGGWLTGVLAIACAITIPWFYRRVRQFERWDATLISDALTRLELGDDRAD